ncbi:MAG: hypothetical protein HY314_05835 [Acidobacteria bacterium]|nr:hypothetical protein [Acidobacteriota bacterium]
MSRRKDIHLELIKNRTKRKVVFKPIFNCSKYNIFIDGKLRYFGIGLTLQEWIEKLEMFERSGITIRVLSRDAAKRLQEFNRTK